MRRTCKVHGAFVEGGNHLAGWGGGAVDRRLGGSNQKQAWCVWEARERGREERRATSVKNLAVSLLGDELKGGEELSWEWLGWVWGRGARGEAHRHTDTDTETH